MMPLAPEPAAVIVVTLAMLFLVTGSLILPVKVVVMSLLTLSATIGLLVLIFQDGRFEGLLGYTSQGALESTQPILLFYRRSAYRPTTVCFCSAIGTGRRLARCERLQQRVRLEAPY
jgi:hypothetical protein